MRDSGKVSLGTLVLLLLLGGAVYFAALYLPLWVDAMDVREAVAAAHNLAGQNRNDAVLRNEIRHRTSEMGTHEETDSLGDTVTVPGLGLTDEQIIIERDEVTGSVLIQVDWERVVTLWPSRSEHTFSFSAVKEGIPPR